MARLLRFVHSALAQVNCTDTNRVLAARHNTKSLTLRRLGETYYIFQDRSASGLAPRKGSHRTCFLSGPVEGPPQECFGALPIF